MKKRRRKHFWLNRHLLTLVISTVTWADSKFCCGELPPLWPSFVPSTIGLRHVGQDGCPTSHVSIHRTWNPWWHLGKTLTFSPSAKSPRQIGHSVAGTLVPGPYTSTGILRRARFFNPVLTEASTGCCSMATLRPHRSAHRTMVLRPSAHTNAHSSAARIITMLVSKFASWPSVVLLFMLLFCIKLVPIVMSGESVGVASGSLSRSLGMRERERLQIICAAWNSLS